MSEENIANHEQDVSLGNKLSILRKELNLSQTDIAAKIYIHSAIIQDIENDDTLYIPDVFFKSYIKSYAEIVGLPPEEYLPFLKMKSKQRPKRKMKNYSQKPQQKRLGKIILFMTIVIILFALSITWFSIWKDNNQNLVEVNHYTATSESTTDI